MNFLMFKLVLEQAEEPEIKLPTSAGIPDHLTCLLRNQYAGQEATVRTVHGTTDQFQMAEQLLIKGGTAVKPCETRLRDQRGSSRLGG